MRAQYSGAARRGPGPARMLVIRAKPVPDSRNRGAGIQVRARSIFFRLPACAGTTQVRIG